MNRINLAPIFGSSTRVAETDETLTLKCASGTSKGFASGNTSLLHSDKSVVSPAEGAMLQAMNTSDVRMDKVAALKSAIENGTYNVSSKAVAEKLVSSMLDKN